MADTSPTPPETDYASIKVRRPVNDEIRRVVERFNADGDEYASTMNLVAIGLRLFLRLPEGRQWEEILEEHRRNPGRRGAKVPA